MTEPGRKPELEREQRESVRKALASPAWRMWTDMSRSDVMAADGDNRQPMLERHKIVVAMIEVNSQQLRCDSQSAGLDVERLTAERDLKEQGDTEATRAALAAIARRTADVEERINKLQVEREWLEQALKDFDAQLPPEKPQIKGRA